MAKKISKEVEEVLQPYNDDVKRHISVLVKKSGKDIKRYTGALSEEFQGRVKVIGEQYGDIKKTLDDHSKTLASHTEQYGDIKKTLDDHSKTLASHTEMIGVLMVDMTTVKGDVKSIKDPLKTKVSRKRFVEFERRVLAA